MVTATGCSSCRRSCDSPLFTSLLVPWCATGSLPQLLKQSRAVWHLLASNFADQHNLKLVLCELCLKHICVSQEYRLILTQATLVCNSKGHLTCRLQYQQMLRKSSSLLCRQTQGETQSTTVVVTSIQTPGTGTNAESVDLGSLQLCRSFLVQASR